MAVKVKKSVANQLVKILCGYGARKISLFGSYSRGEEKRGSDIDLIVDFKTRKSLMELVRIENHLSKAVGKKIDLLTEKSISPYILSRIENERRVLFY
jgi:predicted nucleotidyltransferase